MHTMEDLKMVETKMGSGQLDMSDAEEHKEDDRPLQDFEVMRADGSWICKVCRLHNSSANDRCAACFALPQIREYSLPETGKVIRIDGGKLIMDVSDDVSAVLSDGEVLIKLEKCGCMRTAFVMISKEDINLMSSNLEYTPGRFVTGTVVRIGNDVRRPKIGQKVLVQRREKQFDSLALFGTGQGTTAGGCRQYLVRKHTEVMVLPKKVGLQDGCFLPSLHGASSAVDRLVDLKGGKLNKLDTILVMGCQSQGLFALALLEPLIKKAGARLYACDMNPKLEAKALDFGASEFIAATSIKALKRRISELLQPVPPDDGDDEGSVVELARKVHKERKLTRILDTTGMSKMISESVNLIGAGGVIVLASPQSRGEVSIDLGEFYGKRVSIHSSKPFLQVPRGLKATRQVRCPLASVADKRFELSQYVRAFTAAVTEEVLIDIQGERDYILR